MRLSCAAETCTHTGISGDATLWSVRSACAPVPGAVAVSELASGRGLGQGSGTQLTQPTPLVLAWQARRFHVDGAVPEVPSVTVINGIEGNGLDEARVEPTDDRALTIGPSVFPALSAPHTQPLSPQTPSPPPPSPSPPPSALSQPRAHTAHCIRAAVSRTYTHAPRAPPPHRPCYLTAHAPPPCLGR